MKNFRFEIVGEELVVRIDLSQDHGLSKSGRSRIISSSGGNLRLYDQNGFRSEKINFTCSKEVTKDEQDHGY